MNTKPNAETVARWRRMTDENDHDDVRIEIARWIIANTKIALSDVLEVYEQIKAEHKKSLCLSQMMSFARIGADSVMLGCARIEDEELAKLIDDCL